MHRAREKSCWVLVQNASHRARERLGDQSREAGGEKFGRSLCAQTDFTAAMESVTRVGSEKK